MVPTDLASLQLWFKSDVGLWKDTAGTVAASASGDAIARWDDQSGNGRNATQATSANRPTLSTVVTQNGINSVEFTAATGQWLDLPNFLTAYTEGEVISLTRLRLNQPTVQQRTGYWQFGNEAAGGSLNTHIRWTDGFTYERFGTTVRKESVAITEQFSPNFFIYNVWSKANDYAILCNGTTFYSSASNTVGWTTTPALGKMPSAGFYYDGYWQELIFSSVKLTSLERAGMFDYLVARYAMQGAVRATQIQGAVVTALTGSARVTRLAGAVVGTGPTPARVSQLMGYAVRNRNASRRRTSPIFIG